MHNYIRNVENVLQDTIEKPTVILKPLAIRQHKRGLSPLSESRIENAKKIMSLSTSVPSCSLPLQQRITSMNSGNEPEIRNISSIKVEKYSIEDFLDDWNLRDTKMFPDSWMMIDSHDGLLLGYIGDIPATITRSIFIKLDMTVEVS